VEHPVCFTIAVHCAALYVIYFILFIYLAMFIQATFDLIWQLGLIELIKYFTRNGGGFNGLRSISA